jgi:radical SAM superfamily enzyme YgiQ (UPF0313 family)
MAKDQRFDLRILNQIGTLASTSSLWRHHLSETVAGHVLRKGYKRLLRGRLESNEGCPGDRVISQHSDREGRLNVLLVQLPLPGNRRHKRIIPLGPAYLASYLMKHLPEVNVAILDAQVHDLNHADILREAAAAKWDVIGLSYWTVQRTVAARLSEALRTANPKTLIVHGGVHPTLRPAEALATADLVVVHEGEATLVELCRRLLGREDWSSLRGLAVKDQDGKVRINPPQPALALDEIPFPAYHLLPLDRYTTQLHVVGGRRLPIIGSRGCPYACSFCVSPKLWQRRVRFRSPDNIVAEMEYAVHTLDIPRFHFWDDNFTINPNHTRELCEAIVARGLKIEWVCLDRAEHLLRHKDLLPLMKRAGCVGVEIGLESANPDTLRHINKSQELQDSQQAIVALREAGIAPLYTCMAFNPGESIVGYYYQKEFLDQAQVGLPWHSHFHPLPFPLYIGQFATPYPETPFGDGIETTSRVLLNDDEDRFHHQINTVPLSLLADVPLRTVPQLEKDHLTILLLATRAAFYRDFSLEDSGVEERRKLWMAAQFYFRFFAASNGKLTVDQIAKQIRYSGTWDIVYCTRMCAFACYILGQLGLIRSGLHHLNASISPRTMAIPKAARLSVARVVEPAWFVWGGRM